MSQMNTQNLLKLGNSIPLPQVSPGTPEYNQSTFQGGQVSVGAPRQQVGPSGSEAMYGALAEIAGGISKGIDNFSRISSDIEKQRIEAARIKLKEIKTKEYEDGITPESKLSEWNDYIKEVWTPVLGNTWADDLNLSAYELFGSKEAQDKFESERYQNEATLFFNDPKNTFRLNQNSSFGKKEFDSFYENKYRTASGNRWFRQTKQSNISQYQQEQDALAVQGLEAGLTSFLRMPTAEMNQIVLEGGPQAKKIKDSYSVYYNEILPQISKAEDKDIPDILYKFYVDKLITQNPNQYNEHTLHVLQDRLPNAIAPRVQMLQDLRLSHEIATQKQNAGIAMATARDAVADPQTFTTSAVPYIKTGIQSIPYLGVPEFKQEEAVVGLFTDIWSLGRNKSDNSLTSPIKFVLPPVKEADQLRTLAYKYFPILQQKGNKTNLSALTPLEQVEYMSGAYLAQAIASDPETTQRLITIFKATDVEDLFKKFSSKLKGTIFTSKEFSEATGTVIKNVSSQLESATQSIKGNGNIEDIDRRRQEVINSLPRRLGLNDVRLFRSIYMNLGEVESPKNFVDIDSWYSSLAPEDKKIIDGSGIMYGVNKASLETLAKAAHSFELMAIDTINGVKKTISSEGQDVIKEQAKQVEAERKEAEKLSLISRSYSLSPDISTATQTKGYVGSAFLLGTTAKDKEDRPFFDAVSEYDIGMQILIKYDGKVENITDPIEREQLARVAQVSRWLNSDDPALKLAANEIVTTHKVIEHSINQALDQSSKHLQEIDSSLVGETMTPEEQSQRIKQFQRDFRAKAFKHQLPAFTGTMDKKRAFDSRGFLTDYGFTYLTQLPAIVYQLSGISDTALGTGQFAELANITQTLNNQLEVFSDPRQFLEDKSNLFPYLAVLVYGKALHQAQTEFGMRPQNRQAWFTDRAYIMANLATSVNLHDAAQYFSSSQYRDTLAYIYDFPLNLANFTRGRSSQIQTIQAQGPEDQFKFFKQIGNQNLAIGLSAISQPSTSDLVLMTPEQRDQLLRDRNSESFDQFLRTFASGKTVNPLNSDWSPDWAYSAWKYSGLIPVEMSKEAFARDLYHKFLEGSVDRTRDYSTDEQIRMAFTVMHNIDVNNPQFTRTMIGLSTDPSLGIGTPNYPLAPQGTSPSLEFLNFYTAAAGTFSPAASGTYRDGVAMNSSYSNSSVIQLSESGRMGTLYSTMGSTEPLSYSINSVTGVLARPDVSPYIYKDSVGAQRFTPTVQIIDNKQEVLNGPLYKAGTLVLNAEPSTDILSTILAPYIQELTEPTTVGLFDELPPYSVLTSDIIAEAAKQPTVFDAIIYVNDQMKEEKKRYPGIPLLINETDLFARTSATTFNRTSILPGASTIMQHPNLTFPEQMGFTYPFINRGFSGVPLLHLPNKVWSMPFNLSSIDKETIKKVQEKQQQDKEKARQLLEQADILMEKRRSSLSWRE